MGHVPENPAQAPRTLPLYTPANPTHGGGGIDRIPQYVHLFRLQAVAGQPSAVIPAVGPGSDPSERQAVNEASWFHGVGQMAGNVSLAEQTRVKRNNTLLSLNNETRYPRTPAKAKNDRKMRKLDLKTHSLFKIYKMSIRNEFRELLSKAFFS